MDLKTLRFQIERIAAQEKISNLEMEMFDDHMMAAVVVRMTRRLAVVRRCFEQPGTSTIEQGRTLKEVEWTRPLTWWDHFKWEHPRICRFFNPPVMATVEQTVAVEHDTLAKNYNNVAVVLDDKTELPEAIETLELQYGEKF